VRVPVWNWVVANVSLMAVGSRCAWFGVWGTARAAGDGVGWRGALAARRWH
jgi:hypothetical protein